MSLDAVSKNKIKGYAYLPEVENKQIKFGYKMCSKQKRLSNQNKYLENVIEKIQ